MGLLDELESFAGNAMNQGGQAQGALPAEQQSSVTRALISSVAQHPGGVGGLLDRFRQNGMESHVNSWVNSEPGQGTPQALTPQQVEQGAGSGLLGEVAQKTGLSPQMVSMGLATILPMVMAHMTPNGQVPEQSQMGGLASGLLSKFL